MRKSGKIALLVLLILLVGEVCGQVAYWKVRSVWLFTIPISSYSKLFRPHPYLVAEPMPNGSYVSKKGIKIENTKFGFRGENFASLAKKEGIKRILAFGGSSTYGVGVSNDQTWPFYLGDDLKGKYETINLGVPGYSTAEHLIQTALSMSDFSPDVCIYYVGWNDIRNIHIANLRSDYSDFQGRAQYNTLCLGAMRIGDNSIMVKMASILLRKLFFRNFEGSYKIEPNEDKFTPKVEKRALDIYKRNIRLIIVLAKAQGARVIMVPQVLNYAKLTENSQYGWIPYLDDKDIPAVMSTYNDALRQVCAEEGVDFVKEALEEGFGKEDFLDQGHFTAQGNKKFADIIAKYINKNF